jgi:hypothetical protein
MMRAFVIALLIGTASAANAEPNVALYELQERCAKSAAQVWAKEYDNGKPTTPGEINNYQAHYNSRLNKCFFLEISMTVDKKDIQHMLRLFDLLENKEYGSFWSSDYGVTNCSVQGAICHSEDEWHQLAKPFLED